ncbi:MAG TPA: DUF4833 domain-containing protein [Polyangia bacterium]|jgi:hypothetical protein
MIRIALLVAAAASLLVTTHVALAEPSAQTLFILQRSKNKNEVHYDSQLEAGGKLAAKKPVVAYWRLLAEDGRREELGYFERKKAYGFSVTPEAEGASYTMKLIAAPDRSIKVSLARGTPRAEMVIGGQPAVLKRIYITTEEGRLIPKVRSVELFGVHAGTGKPLYERVIRN